MSVFLKRGKWWGRKGDGECKRFDTEAEAYAFTGDEAPKKERPATKRKKAPKPKKVEKFTLGEADATQEESNTEEESSSEETSTYEQETVFFGKSYGKKKI